MNAAAPIAAPLLTMRGVIKRFGGVQALRGVDFDLKRGEIHALLGENGAGKSTLMNVLSGVIEPDGGEMLLEGAAIRFSDPRAAQAAGVATIFQELDLVPGLDVTANLFLGRELTRATVLDRGAMREAARERLATVGADIDVDQMVGELSVGRRQMVAIAKALTYASQNPGHGRADRRPDRRRGRAAVPRHARDRRPRRRHRLYLPPARGGAARRRPSHRLRDGQVAGMRRPRRRSRNSCGCSSDGRSPSSIRSARREFGKPVLRLERAGYTPRRVRAGWQAPVEVRSRCGRARS